MTEKDFQIDADRMALSANQIDVRWKSANQRSSSKYQFEIPMKTSPRFEDN